MQDGGAGYTLANAVNINGNVTFGSAGAGGLTLGPQTLSTPNTVTITGSPTIYVTAPTTIADQVTGALVKDGPSTLTLTAATNSLTGTTLVNGGSLVGTVANLATPVTLANGANVTFYQATDATLTTPINGTGSLGKSGPGVLTLGALQPYSGTTTISGGTLKLSAPTYQPALMHLDHGRRRRAHQQRRSDPRFQRQRQQRDDARRRGKSGRRQVSARRIQFTGGQYASCC